jgi:hypothetical protein
MTYETESYLCPGYDFVVTFFSVGDGTMYTMRMGAPSTEKTFVLLLLVLGLWSWRRLSPLCVAVVNVPTTITSPLLRLYVGETSRHNNGEEGGLANVALVQFHALSQLRFLADSNSSKAHSVDSFCNSVAGAISDLSDEESFENMRAICQRDLVLRGSDHFVSFVYTKRSTTPHTARWMRPPPPYTVSKRYYKAYGFNPGKTGHVEELRSNGVFRRVETNAKRESFHNYSWNVHLETKLSPSGGMHRDLHHTLWFYDQPMNPLSANLTYYGSVDIVWHLPSDLFINIENCFRWTNRPQNAFQIENISTVTSTLIDQEEPAFVSPSHLLRIRIEFSVLCSTMSPARSIAERCRAHPGSLEFTTQIHARYPKPVSAREVQNSFQLLWIPPPILISGIETNRVQMDLLSMPWREEVEWLQWWVAPGHQRHFFYVLGATIAAAVLGAMWMWLALSQISVWN